jgi:hypothetical protein
MKRVLYTVPGGHLAGREKTILPFTKPRRREPAVSNVFKTMPGIRSRRPSRQALRAEADTAGRMASACSGYAQRLLGFMQQ